MKRAVTGILCVSLLLGASAARAQGGDPAAEREARLRFQEGLSRVQAHDFEAARIAFAQAFAVLHKPDILWNLALSEEKSGHLVDALGHFQQLDRDLPSSADHAPPRKHADDLMAQTGHIAVLAPPGSLISVDGSPDATAPLKDPWNVMPGHHVINARIGGAPARSVEVDAFAGRTVNADFGGGDTAPPPPPPPGATGAPSPQPGDTGALPPSPPAPETASSSGGIPTAKLVTVIAVGGAALLSGGLALGFGAASTSNANKANTLASSLGASNACAGSGSSQCAQLKSERSAQSTDHGVSEGLWVTAGVLAAADVGIWFLWPRASSNEPAATPAASVRVMPSAGPGTAGLVAVGSF